LNAGDVVQRLAELVAPVRRARADLPHRRRLADAVHHARQVLAASSATKSAGRSGSPTLIFATMSRRAAATASPVHRTQSAEVLQ
jgi:hypothetical protein